MLPSCFAACISAQLQSSQLAEPLWTDPGLKSGISVCELMSTSKKEKKKRAGDEWMVEHSPKIVTSEEEAATTTVSEVINKVGLSGSSIK